MTERETVLVVDDEPIIRKTTRRVLERAGYAVVEAPGGAEALEVIRQNGCRYTAVLLDVRMPDMTGPQTFVELRRDHPELPVVFLTAQSRRELEVELRQPRVGFVPKPFERHELIEMLEIVSDVSGSAHPQGA